MQRSRDLFPKKIIQPNENYELDYEFDSDDVIIPGEEVDKEYKYLSEYERDDLELKEALGHIWDIAHENGMDPFETVFEVVPPNIMSQIAGYTGLQDRFSHWTFGRTYHQMKTQYDHGLSKIYELVINSDPAEAFLLENNPPIENKFVMAHVLGHTDFFKNNFRFKDTNRNMPRDSAINGERIRKYESEYGREEIETFLDSVLAIESHTDPFRKKRPYREAELNIWRNKHEEKVSLDLEKLQDSRKGMTVRQKIASVAMNIPPEPDKDILGFIRNHAPYLEEWQRDIVDIVRDEAIYFYPQRRTKIMNEGWAAYWHKRIMQQMGDRGLITDDEDLAWFKVHSGVVQPSTKQLNPYHLGMKIYEYLEDYYNGNLSDKEVEWLRRQGKEIYPRFDGELKDSPAADKLREVMETNDDQSFIRNYFDKNVSERIHMYAYEKNERGEDVIKSTGWQDVRDKLIGMLDNSGRPSIVVVDGDYEKAGSLYLRHEFDDKNLDPSYINKTLPYVQNLWGRTVMLETVQVDKQSGKRSQVTYTCENGKVSKKSIAL